ncbi:uncharacterized protein PAC_09224 [Phialocephala subalpina]|uniref:Heterokaryon incompatibility domain-containing protein n=1 Tax=Phialocephala subalpina TaxID=576137 RepID=A0A1L7X2S7_9HELO|nr:uncharacterized protein PAC_09224 [Phialocephala subalpina]
MRGIFEAAHRASPNGPRNFWGLLPHQHVDQDQMSDQDFLTSLCWMHTGSSERQCKFPSWSWTGWKGAVQFMMRGNKYWALIPLDDRHDRLVFEVAMQQCSLRYTHWCDLGRQLVARVSYADWKTELLVKGSIVKLNFVWLCRPPEHTLGSGPLKKGPGIFVKCHGTFSSYSPVWASGSFATETSALLSGEWDCLAVAKMQSIEDNSQNYCFLILEWKEEVAQRIGFINFGRRVWDDESEELRKQAANKGSSVWWSTSHLVASKRNFLLD